VSEPGDRDPEIADLEHLADPVTKAQLDRYHATLGRVDYRSGWRCARCGEPLGDIKHSCEPTRYDQPRWVDLVAWLLLLAGGAFGVWLGPALVGWWFR
jgi:hypothetical protein